MSDKLYSGCALKNLIGDRNDQTPLIRYRLMTILQNLVETNISLFVEQSIKLLESSSVRIYFKCTVFEIIGQCENRRMKSMKLLIDIVRTLSGQLSSRKWYFTVIHNFQKNVFG